MIKVKKVTPGDLLPPKQAKPVDAGYDLRSAVQRTVTINPGEQKVVPTRYAWEIPLAWVGLVRPRSGLAVKNRIDVRAGVVDSSFRGEVKAVLVNEGCAPLYINYGDRIAQMVVVPCMLCPVITVSQLDDSERGADGFGSTGTN